MTPFELLKQHYSAEGQRRIRQARVDGAVLDRMVDKALTEIKVLEYEGLIRIDTILFGPAPVYFDLGHRDEIILFEVYCTKEGKMVSRRLPPSEVYAPAF